LTARVNTMSESIVQLAKEIDALREALRKVEAAPSAMVAKLESASSKAERLLSKDAIALAQQRARDITDIYQATWAMMSTLEMVIYAVSRSPALQKRIQPGVAAAKLVRLMGFGSEYFHDRRHWTIENWVEHLAGINDRGMPSGGYESTPVSEYTLNR
jgi:hypothetical protein